MKDSQSQHPPFHSDHELCIATIADLIDHLQRGLEAADSLELPLVAIRIAEALDLLEAVSAPASTIDPVANLPH